MNSLRDFSLSVASCVPLLQYFYEPGRHRELFNSPEQVRTHRRHAEQSSDLFEGKITVNHHKSPEFDTDTRNDWGAPTDSGTEQSARQTGTVSQSAAAGTVLPFPGRYARNR